MPHDPALVAETHDWLVRAKEDLEVADRLMEGPSYPSPAAFHAQQAAEKTQKAFLTWHGRQFSKTHDLGVLGGDCIAIDPTLAAVSSAVAPISGYAVESRYPGSWGPLTDSEAHEAIRLAREVYEAVVSRLPAEVIP